MKAEHKELLRERAREALRNLYHNATPAYVSDLRGRSEDYFQSWFEGAAEFKIEYLNDGGAYGKNPRATINHSANRKYKSEKAHARYVAHYLRNVESERSGCGMLTGWRVMERAAGNPRLAVSLIEHQAYRRHDAMWECATDYGKVYQYGRGGRTLAPCDLMSGRNLKESYADEMSYPQMVRFIRIIESFNRFVESWNAEVPALWKEHCDMEDAEAQAEKNRIKAAKCKETKERNYWNSRDTITKG